MLVEVKQQSCSLLHWAALLPYRIVDAPCSPNLEIGNFGFGLSACSTRDQWTVVTSGLWLQALGTNLAAWSAKLHAKHASWGGTLMLPNAA
jgi:hypothetical protein